MNDGRLNPYQGGLTDWIFGAKRVQLANGAILPRIDQLITRDFESTVNFLRAVVEVCPESSAVRQVAINEVMAHVHEFRGGRNSVRRMQDYYAQSDQGDGWRTTLGRMYDDFLTSGWCVVGNEWRGGQLIDTYHVDAATCRFNAGDKEHPSERYPIRCGDFYFERTDAQTQAWWIFAGARSKRQIKKLGGIFPSSIPFLGVYEDIRTLMLERAIEHAQMTGEAIWKVAFVSEVKDKDISDAETVARKDAEQEESKTVSGALIIPVASEVKLSELEVRRSADPQTRQQSLERAILNMCNAAGVNPLDVYPKLSGSGGLNEGTKAQVADDRRGGRAIAQFMDAVTANENRWVNPNNVETYYTFIDPRDKQREITQTATLLRELTNAAGKPIVSVDEARAIMQHQELVPDGILNKAEIDEVTELEQADLADNAVIPVDQAPEPAATTKSSGEWKPNSEVDDTTLEEADAILKRIRARKL